MRVRLLVLTLLGTAAFADAPQDLIRKSIHQRRAALHRCLEAEAEKPHLSCKVATVRFEVGTDGHVSEVTIDDPLEASTKTCLVTFFRALTTPALPQPLKVTYPIQVRWAQ